jgi:hypothetical protein
VLKLGRKIYNQSSKFALSEGRKRRVIKPKVNEWKGAIRLRIEINKIKVTEKKIMKSKADSLKRWIKLSFSLDWWKSW